MASNENSKRIWMKWSENEHKQQWIKWQRKCKNKINEITSDKDIEIHGECSV